MREVRATYVAMVLAVACAPVASQTLEGDMASRRILMKFAAGSATPLSVRSALPDGGAIELTAVPATEAWTLLRSAAVATLTPLRPGISLEPLPGGIERIFVATIRPDADPQTSLNKLRASSEVEYAEFDAVGHGAGYRPDAWGGGADLNAADLNDPYFGYQWALQNSGQSLNGVIGTVGADAHVVPAWSTTVGSDSVILAVLDSGIPPYAADFAGRVVAGYDFVNNDAYPADDHGHGTNVTSIAAATGNNSVGIAGVDWRCKIMPLKTLDANNTGYYSQWASGFVFAADSGADVINISAGGSSFSQALSDAVTYATARGAIVVACMMNTNSEVSYYPAAFQNVIAVGATNNVDNRAQPFCYSSTSGSNVGSHIDFVAPGEMIAGLRYSDPTQANFWCGTSQATPVVAGTIALMRGLKPDLKFTQVYDILKATARDTIAASGEDTPGWDKYFGWGKIDAAAAVAAVLAVVSVEDSPGATVPATISLEQNYPNPFNPTTEIRYQVSRVSNVKLVVYDLLGREVAVLVDGPVAAGRHEVVFDASDLGSGVYFARLSESPGRQGDSPARASGGGSVAVRRMMLLK